MKILLTQVAVLAYYCKKSELARELFNSKSKGSQLMSGFKDPDFLARQSAAATARKAALERFRANAADPVAAEKAAARQAVNEAREARAAERKAAKEAAALAAEQAAARSRELAEQAAREAAAAAERERAEQAVREAAIEAEQKAARDARYAARKARGKKKK